MKRWLARQTTRHILARWVRPCSLRRRIQIEFLALAGRWFWQPKSHQQMLVDQLQEYARRQTESRR